MRGAVIPYARLRHPPYLSKLRSVTCASASRRCTAVCCSTGNETIWEAVCRGVPVLTIPTFQHGEQIMNAVAHARALPHLVRTRMRLRIADVRWLTSFEHTDESRRESAGLRERCAAVAEGLDRLLAAPYEAPVIIDRT